MVLVGLPSRWPGCRLLDVQGARVGTIVRVRGDITGDPRWIVVDLGRLSPRLVPVPAGDAIGWSGQVTVPYSRATIRLAPELWRPDDVIDERTAEHLRRHYGLAPHLTAGRAPHQPVRSRHGLPADASHEHRPPGPGRPHSRRNAHLHR